MTIPEPNKNFNYNIQNKNKPARTFHIDFTKYRNWDKSVQIKNIQFSNHYKDNKHISKTLSRVIFDIFPYVQENILKIMSGNIESKCHKINGNNLDRAWRVIDKIYENNSFDRDMEIYQLGVTSAERVVGVMISGEYGYTFYPLFIDCNHLIYPSEKHNSKDYLKFKKKIR